ncbi:MAG: imidazole glycerol phosphate synthase subunit HisH [Proteobacteria bacterium]|jgi:glutamine amidotransferase|nr:imidazole glycerol phosphate synthase subunit HisH [Alphaproteobacteria bacterium]NCC04084.1 imidazole glycerol phosphate synthase subunit HisH [Pseudomonadota bacterium]
MIVIVDSGVANLTSVLAAMERLGREATISDDPATIQRADHVILPGVGAAKAAMKALESKGLVDVIRGLTQPVLGICLGLQILFDQSQESGGTPCLGLIKGDVAALPSAQDAPTPHMGWNQITFEQPDHPLLRGLLPDASYYFVHSFAADIGPHTLASAAYNKPFTAIAAHGNFMGCQFHPERSGHAGERVLTNFLGM